MKCNTMNAHIVHIEEIRACPVTSRRRYGLPFSVYWSDEVRIEKVLNNNAVVAIKDEQEVIVIGRGIAFQKRRVI